MFFYNLHFDTQWEIMLLMWFLFLNILVFLVRRDSGVSLKGGNIPSTWATMLALHLDCSTAALTAHQKVLSIWKPVELKMPDFSDRRRTGISILTSAADIWSSLCPFIKVGLSWEPCIQCSDQFIQLGGTPNWTDSSSTASWRIHVKY